MRLIDADALITDIKECMEAKNTNFEWEQVDGLKVALSCIDEMPTIKEGHNYIEEEDVLKFYYVESLDDYWIGQRLDTMYYATWDKGLNNFVWSKSRYLPWGEHVIAPTTAWKEYTYPSKPKEIPFAKWLKGFYKKYFQQEENNNE